MGLQDIIESLPGNGNQLCQLGAIKIGGKSRTPRSSASGTWYAPEKYDSFHITTLNRDGTGHLIEDAALMAQLVEKHGEDGKLRQIPIRLLSDDIDDIIQSAFVWYGSKSIGARSDGKRVTWFRDPQTLQAYDPPREEDWTADMLEWTYAVKGKPVKMFKCHSVLNCVIAANEARWGGVYKFRTTSVISIKQLHASLLHLLQLTGGILVGMPLMLVVRPVQVSPNGTATTVHVVHVELRGGDFVQLQERALEMAKFRLAFAGQIQATTKQYRKLLALPGYEGDAEAGDIASEFSPESVETPDVQSIPEDKPFGLLDDAPPAPMPAAMEQVPAQQQEQSAAVDPLPGDIEFDEPPDDGPPQEIADAQQQAPKPDPYAGILRWDDFVSAMQERAQKIGIAPSECDKIIGTIAVRKHWKGKDASKADPEFMRDLVRAVDVQEFDWKTGWRKKPELQTETA